jgi:UbiD family decarboxylase
MLDDVHPSPTIKVDCITHRNNAILSVSSTGRLTDECHTLLGSMAAAEVRQLCQDKGLSITDVNLTLESQITWLALKVDTAKLREMKTDSKTFSKQIDDFVFSQKASWVVTRLVLVGDGINVFDSKDVMWAFLT